MTYDEVFNMPVNLRSYYYAKLADIMESRRKDAEQAKNNAGRKR